MNTARQLLWVPTSREEKYKAKQAIDTFFVRAGDVISAGVVLLGTQLLHLSVQQFAIANIALTIVWLGVALLILRPERVSRPVLRPLMPAAAVIALLLIAAPASAQESREEHLAAQRAEKGQRLAEYKPDPLEHRLGKVESALSTFSRDGLYPFVGGVMSGGGMAIGPGYRGRYADSGAWDVHGAWSFRNFRAVDAAMQLPAPCRWKGSNQCCPQNGWMRRARVLRESVATRAQTTAATSPTRRRRSVVAGHCPSRPDCLPLGSGVESLQFETKLAGRRVESGVSANTRVLPRSTRARRWLHTRGWALPRRVVRL
jgi:hypothetical protein